MLKHWLTAAALLAMGCPIASEELLDEDLPAERDCTVRGMPDDAEQSVETAQYEVSVAGATPEDEDEYGYVAWNASYRVRSRNEDIATVVFANGTDRYEHQSREAGQVPFEVTCLKPGGATITVDGNDLARGSTACERSFQVTCVQDIEPPPSQIEGLEPYTSTLDCTVDLDDCIVSEVWPCRIWLDEVLTGDDAKLEVLAELDDGKLTSSWLDITFWAEETIYTMPGPRCGNYLAGGELERSITNEDLVRVAEDATKTGGSQLAGTFTCEVSGRSSVASTTEPEPMPSDPLRATTTGGSTDTRVVIDLARGRICATALTQ